MKVELALQECSAVFCILRGRLLFTDNFFLKVRAGTISSLCFAVYYTTFGSCSSLYYSFLSTSKPFSLEITYVLPVPLTCLLSFKIFL